MSLRRKRRDAYLAFCHWPWWRLTLTDRTEDVDAPVDALMDVFVDVLFDVALLVKEGAGR